MCTGGGAEIWMLVRKAILTGRENKECFTNKITDITVLR